MTSDTAVFEAVSVEVAPIATGERRLRPRNTFVYRSRRERHLLRRVCDTTVAGLALIAVMPILVLAALAIYIEDRGPIVFSQKRVGRFGVLFTIYKLRTMRVSQCGDQISPTSSGDARITKVGKVLRQTSIDELPQLINIVCGSMTLVGPRPEMPFIVSRYAPWQHLRHLALPGLTGLWQITCRSTVPLHRYEATALDLEYISRLSPTTDLKLFVQTFSSIVKSKGAY